MTSFLSELPTVLWWYIIITGIGILFYPITFFLFKPFFDKGYALSKILGIALTGYSIWLLGSLHIAPFTLPTILLILAVWTFINFKLYKPKMLMSIDQWPIIIIEEFLFLFGLLLWVYIRGHEPSIHGLEKFMDIGFINSILNTTYFPPQDMWLAPRTTSIDSYTGGFFINYYYFGHFTTAFLTKLSGISSGVTYNLMLSTILGLSLSGTFSIGFNLIKLTLSNIKNNMLPAVGGFISALIVTFAGNLHTIYIFTKGYENEHPVPFWQIWKTFSAGSEKFFATNYWYPNATRFIPNTIHEFPAYSWVVADLHGHVLDIPFVLLTIGLLFSILLNSKHEPKNFKQIRNNNTQNNKQFRILNLGNLKLFLYSIFDFRILLLGLLTAIMYMTNAWDGLIYLALSLIAVFIVHIAKNLNDKGKLLDELVRLSTGKYLKWQIFPIALVLISFIIFSFPFSSRFLPFVHGVGIVGGYEFFDATGLKTFLNPAQNTTGGENADVLTFGPFLFEKGNNLNSPYWMLAVLWGFFIFHIILLLWLVTKYVRVNLSIKIGSFAILKMSTYFITTAILAFSAIYFESLAISLKESSLINNKSAMILTYASILFATLFLIFIVYAIVHFFLKIIVLSKPLSFALLLSLAGIGLITAPEFFYAKDIYPGHYRANTMFKLGYQAFIMFSIVSGYTIILLKKYLGEQKKHRDHYAKSIYILSIITLVLVMIYPYFAVDAFYGVFKSTNLGGRTYETINGIKWLATSHPDDLAIINWINSQPKYKEGKLIILVESVGDSYTDYGRISAYTGLPTVLGWPVHEWLWRGSYDEPGKRVEEVKQFYEASDRKIALSFLNEFTITYIIIGQLERNKYPNINESLISTLGKKVFESGTTAVYEVYR